MAHTAKDAARERKRFVAWGSCFKNSAAERLKKKIEKHRDHIKRLEAERKRIQSWSYLWHYEAQLCTLRYEMHRVKGRLEQCKRSRRILAVSTVPLEQQYENILAIPMIRDARIIRNRFVIRTETLYGRDPGGYDYPLGPWRRIGRPRLSINITCEDGGVESACRWYSPEHHERDGWHAPQIDRTRTRWCYGSAADEEHDRALRKFRIDRIVALYVRFSECFVPGAERSRAEERWPRADPEEVPEWYIKNWGE